VIVGRFNVNRGFKIAAGRPEMAPMMTLSNPPKSVRCDERERLLKDWALCADTQAQVLGLLRKRTATLQPDACERILQSALRASFDCELARAALERHRAEHRCHP
jgi:hypothetical protein